MAPRLLGDADGPAHVLGQVRPDRRREVADQPERGADRRLTQRWPPGRRRIEAWPRRNLGTGCAAVAWQSAAMRFVVMGAGAIGGLVGARLFQQGEDVTLVARGAHAEALRRGLVLEAPDETVTLPIPVVTDPADGDLDRGHGGAAGGQGAGHRVTRWPSWRRWPTR